MIRGAILLSLPLLPLMIYWAFILCAATRDFRDNPTGVGRIIKIPVDADDDTIELITYAGDMVYQEEVISGRCKPTRVVKHFDGKNYVCPICGSDVDMKCAMKKWMPQYEIQISCNKCYFSAVGIVRTSEKLFRILKPEKIKFDW